MIFKRRGLATRTFPPVSLVLATRSQDYITALQATRYEGPADSAAALASTRDWVSLFAAACSQAVRDAESFETRVESLREQWRERLGPLRSHASAIALLDQLIATPIVTAQSAAKSLGVSFNAANAAVKALVDAGILFNATAGRRNRAFEARELVDAVTDLGTTVGKSRSRHAPLGAQSSRASTACPAWANPLTYARDLASTPSAAPTLEHHHSADFLDQGAS